MALHWSPKLPHFIIMEISIVKKGTTEKPKVLKIEDRCADRVNIDLAFWGLEDFILYIKK